jgi:hypothetical protein
MKMCIKIIRGIVLFIATSAVFLAHNVLAQTPIFPPTFQKTADETFASGKKCFIWADKDVSIEIMSDFGTSIFIRKLYVVSRSPDVAVPFEPAYEFTTQSQTNTAPTSWKAALKIVPRNGVKISASPDKAADFPMIISLNSKNGYVSITGKGYVDVYLVNPTEKEGVVGPPISNTLRINIDIDNKQIIGNPVFR